MLISTQVIEPATSYGLISLEDAKLLLGVSAADTSSDEALTLQIEHESATIAAMCNRVFARERVVETYRLIGTERIYLNHWPVKQEDIESIVDNGNPVASGFPAPTNDYELDSNSGMLYRAGGWQGPAVVASYTGGYQLPDEAPLALQQACVLMLRTWFITYKTKGLQVRSISHKGARVMYFDPNQVARSGTSGSSTQSALDKLLVHFTRPWI